MMNWNEILLNIIDKLLELVIALGIPYAFSLIRAKVKSDIQIKYLNKVQAFVVDAVAQVQQTYVSEMRKAGTFDKVAQATAFCKAREAVFAMMNERTKEIVTEAVGDIEVYIKNAIEARVYDVKNFEANGVIVETPEAA